MSRTSTSDSGGGSSSGGGRAAEAAAVARGDERSGTKAAEVVAKAAGAVRCGGGGGGGAVAEAAEVSEEAAAVARGGNGEGRVVGGADLRAVGRRVPVGWSATMRASIIELSSESELVTSSSVSSISSISASLISAFSFSVSSSTVSATRSSCGREREWLRDRPVSRSSFLLWGGLPPTCMLLQNLQKLLTCIDPAPHRDLHVTMDHKIMHGAQENTLVHNKKYIYIYIHHKLILHHRGQPSMDNFSQFHTKPAR